MLHLCVRTTAAPVHDGALERLLAKQPLSAVHMLKHAEVRQDVHEKLQGANIAIIMCSTANFLENCLCHQMQRPPGVKI